MADKTQNININYNFNTSQVERAKSLMQQADQAAQKFQQTGQKSGQTINNAYKTTGQSIETVRARVELLREQIIRASDPKAVKKLSDEYKKLKTQLDTATKAAFGFADAQKKVTQETNKMGKEVQGSAQSFINLYNGVKLFFAAAIIKQTVGTAIEMAKLAGNVQGVERAFRRAFPEADNILFNLRQATKGTVTDFELMQRTLQATNLGVAVEKLPILFQFAAARAQQTGESVDYLVDSIVRGIGRKSILVLDNLGLSATRLKEKFGGAALASQSVAKVTEGVAEIAKEELEKMGGYVDTAATKVDNLTANFQELKKEVSEISTQDGGLIDYMNDYVKSFEALAEARRRGISVEDLYRERLREHNANFRFNLFVETELTKTREENIRTVYDEITSLQKSVDAWRSLRDELNLQIETIKGPYREGKRNLYNSEVEEIRLIERLRDAKKEEAREDEVLIGLLNKRMKALKDSRKNEEELIDTLGLIEAKQAQIESVSDLIKTSQSKEEIAELNQELIKLQIELSSLKALGTGIFGVKEDDIKSVSARLGAATSKKEIHALNLELSQLQAELNDLKAIGISKQFLNVGGQIRLVPVIDPKEVQKTLEQEPIFKDGVTIPATIGFTTGTRSAGDALTDGIEQQIQDAVNKIPPINVPVQITPMDTWDKLGAEFEENWRGILGHGLDDTANFFNSVIQSEADQYDARIQQAQEFYDRQMILAGDNENFKDRLRLREAQEERKLRMQAFEADKRAKKSQAAINGAVAITNAFATLGPIAGAVAAITIAASTLAQIAAIDREKPRFAKGGLNIQGPGSSTSDSINAKLSKGESVMTADETRSSFGILKSIRAKTLDDKVLEQLRVGRDGVTYASGMSDKRIVKELQSLKNSIPDYGEQYGVLWRTKSRSETYTKWVRSKTM